MNAIQQMLWDTGMLTIKLPVKHLSSDYVDEFIINADCWCDIGGHKVPEWMMQNVQGDAAVCSDCYDHYN